MTDNLPAIRQEDGREITTADTDSWISVASDVVKLANLIAPTEFVPVSLRDSAPATAAAILYGREVGLPPMTALTQTHVIEGRPAMSAEAMRALVLAAGHTIEVVDTNRARCELRGKRHGQERWTTVVVSIDEYRHLTSNPKKVNWQNYPRQMLQARATAELCRLVFPDVIHGFRATEEFDDLDAVEGQTPAAPSTTVRRASKKTAAKKTAAPPIEAGERPELPAGPPLPGEDGYEETSAGGAPGALVTPSAGSEVTPPAEAETTVDDAAEPSTEGGPGTPAGEDEGEASEPAGDPVEEPPGAAEPRGPRKATRAQLRMLFGLLKDLNAGEDMPDEDRMDVAKIITGRPIGSFNDLTHDNASALIDTLGRVKSREELDELLAATSRARADLWNQGDRS